MINPMLTFLHNRIKFLLRYSMWEASTYEIFHAFLWTSLFPVRKTYLFSLKKSLDMITIFLCKIRVLTLNFENIKDKETYIC